VGYQIRLEAKRSAQTKLLFCTTGVLLRRLVMEPTLQGVSHVVVDEIHERGINEDFLLIILRDLLPARPGLKLVLMSATLNAELFSSYFAGAPRAHIPGFTFPVVEHFLEEFLESSGHTLQAEVAGTKQANRFQRQSHAESGSGSGNGGGQRGSGDEHPNGSEGDGVVGVEGNRASTIRAAGSSVSAPPSCSGLSSTTQQSLRNWRGRKHDKLDVELAEAAVRHVCLTQPAGAVLVFLTGWQEITQLYEKLRDDPELG
jgi:ATP-dependent RNA helicase DHX36